jgi:hypothetical protein
MTCAASFQIDCGKKLAGQPVWKPATQQVWKPALRQEAGASSKGK